MIWALLNKAPSRVAPASGVCQKQGVLKNHIPQNLDQFKQKSSGPKAVLETIC